MSIGKDIELAADLINRGELVAFPTETVYGLGADATSPDALARLYRAKGRPTDHPVIVHIHDVSMLSEWAVAIPDTAFVLAESFWPGPLTLVLRRKEGVLNQVTGGQDTVGLRIPGHPLALELIEKAASCGIAAPSANKFGRLSPTRAEDVAAEFGDEVSYVLDGGPCQVGIESTIVDLTGESWRILRPGQITETAIRNALALDSAKSGVETPRAPGSMKSHYAPSRPLVIVQEGDLDRFLGELASQNKTAAVLSFRQRPGTFSSSWIVAERNREDYGKDLYASLRSLDTTAPDWIVVESPPEDPEWDGVRDRLIRAAFRKD
ncbi:MAG: threonylcarbamoyl-AMP synthase [Cyanobacteria bacterium HKST-UBA02]|nr:threonylcarbamoyl-AMP synthase [Cyanobacteria bacterium HKST-UBA02]